jgi:hypothetical protein
MSQEKLFDWVCVERTLTGDVAEHERWPYAHGSNSRVQASDVSVGVGNIANEGFSVPDVARQGVIQVHPQEHTICLIMRRAAGCAIDARKMAGVFVDERL